MPRVVITGIGVISAIGLTRDAFWRSLVAGTCGIHNVNSSDFEHLRFKHAADVEGFVPEDHLPPKDISLMDR
ncbi:MAG: nodulation protein, partial [Acidobacteriaceae bacterium]|nr:nodulation protein [Acidobacteriaceae bacterium]